MLDVKILLTFLLALLARDLICLAWKWIAKSTKENIASDTKWRKKVGAPLFNGDGKIVLDKQEKLGSRKVVKPRTKKKVTKDHKKVLCKPRKKVECY